jgi:predicted transcriptional regulator
MKLLLYCTKAKPVLKICTSDCSDYIVEGNGKIVAECDYECEHLYNAYDVIDDNAFHYFDTDTLKEKELIERSCVSNLELEKYFGKSNGYAIHIKNLHIFDEPKELSDYYTFNGIANDVNSWKPIEKAPQNMMYAYELISELGLSGTCNMHLKKNIVISIQPQWMCLILNHIKDVEVRRVVLKEMLK